MPCSRAAAEYFAGDNLATALAVLNEFGSHAIEDAVAEIATGA
jgi:hypothetical protein